MTNNTQENKTMTTKTSKTEARFYLSFDGCVDKAQYFATREEAERFIKDSGPSIWYHCEYSVKVVSR